MKLIVDKIVDETADIRSFRLVRADGAALAPYEPGAHIDVTGPTGVLRQYSLCGAPDDEGAYTIAVKRELQSRGGSAALHDAVTVGMALEVGAPRSLFGLHPGASEHVLFGAGIGITPLIAMGYRLLASGQPFTLHYFARGAAQAAYADLLAGAQFAPHVRFHYGVGRNVLARYLDVCLAAASAQAHVYTCGPAGFMETVVQRAALSRGDEAIHLEHFQAAAPAPDSAGGDGTFQVRLASSGAVLQVPAGRSIVDVLADAGVSIDTSCREGICGTCVVPLLEGEPEHRDNCLSKKEKAANDQICLCISRARSATLVLDL